MNFNAPESGAHPVRSGKIVSQTDNASESQAPGFRDGHTINIFPARIQHRIDEDFAWRYLDPDFQILPSLI